MNNAAFKDEYPYKKRAIKAARDLNYGDDIIHKIKVAMTDNEILKIMMAARKESRDTDADEADI